MLRDQLKRVSTKGLNVRIPPEDLQIADAKITRYLLVLKVRNDKSKFLAQAGFNRENPEVLRIAIQTQAVAAEAVEDRKNEYGTFYQVEGDLIVKTGYV